MLDDCRIVLSQSSSCNLGTSIWVFQRQLNRKANPGVPYKTIANAKILQLSCKNQTYIEGTISGIHQFLQLLMDVSSKNWDRIIKDLEYQATWVRTIMEVSPLDKAGNMHLNIVSMRHVSSSIPNKSNVNKLEALPFQHHSDFKVSQYLNCFFFQLMMENDSG